MTAGLPSYYSALKPFRACFRAGLPILTYHSLGPRPRGARLKGLYLPTALFRRQLAELRAAGFATAPLPRGRLDAPATPQVVLTFDDGCRNVFEHGLPLLAETGFRAVQYLVADLLGRASEWQAREGGVAEPLMDAAQVREWLAAGHGIGSHTCTHPWLTHLPVARAREEITASRKKLEDLFGVPVPDFCYPYGDFDARIRDLVAEAGYQTAVTTLAGVNLPGADLLTLRRFTARYPSRRLKDLWQRWRAALAG
jgi:peptidoglycan/xylan/chitin deacetylase (PgdA/CDA1 family)